MNVLQLVLQQQGAAESERSLSNTCKLQRVKDWSAMRPVSGNHLVQQADACQSIGARLWPRLLLGGWTLPRTRLRTRCQVYTDRGSTSGLQSENLEPRNTGDSPRMRISTALRGRFGWCDRDSPTSGQNGRFTCGVGSPLSGWRGWHPKPPQLGLCGRRQM